MVGTSLGRLSGRRFREETRERWQADFHRLWAAQSVALFGTEITVLALPLMAALLLEATPLQMGLLVAAGEAPFLLCSLFFGVLADRVRRRPLLVAADVGRALLLAAIPVAATAGVLRIEVLYVVAFLAGVLSVLFEVAHYAYVPALVPGTDLTAANGKLQVSYSAAAAIGPGLAGLLIQRISAPFAVLGTAASFLVSAGLLDSISRHEAPPGDGRPHRGLRAEIGEGLRALLGHPLLRPIVVASAAIGVFLYAVRALYVLFATRELGLDAAQIGLVLAVGGIAAVPGGLLAARVAATVGFGTAIWGGWLVSGAALLLIPLATAQTAIPLLIAAQAIAGLAEPIANVNQWSLRQIVTPGNMQARVTASHRFLVYGVFPLGALLGGALATVTALRAALLLCAAGAALSPLLLLASPLKSLREPPVGMDDAGRGS